MSPREPTVDVRHVNKPIAPQVLSSAKTLDPFMGRQSTEKSVLISMPLALMSEGLTFDWPVSCLRVVPRIVLRLAPSSANDFFRSFDASTYGIRAAHDAWTIWQFPRSLME